METTIIIVAVIVVLAIFYFGFLKNYLAKKKLVTQIMDKYTNPSSKDYSSAFEGTPDVLMKTDIKTLQGILAGTIR